jgi:hypothetical protein
MWNAMEAILKKLTAVQLSTSNETRSHIQCNGEQYSIVKRGLIFKHQCLIKEDESIWLTIKKRGSNNFKLVFSSGHKYHLEVLTFSLPILIFYSQDDTELFRLTQQAFAPNAVSLLVSEADMPEPEFFAMAAWGFYFLRNGKMKNGCQLAA